MFKFKNTKTFRTSIVILATLVLFAVGIIMVILAKNGIAIPCIFNKLTGLECAGCGNTRAVVALLGLNFKAAFNYNPLCFLQFFYLIWLYAFTVKNYIRGIGLKYQFPVPLVDYICWAAIIVWTVVRNFI